jgi:hypothetical protein
MVVGARGARERLLIAPALGAAARAADCVGPDLAAGGQVLWEVEELRQALGELR